MSAAAVTGWYGPMIDLSSAAFHVDDFVQLLVLVRRCCSVPSQKLKTSNGRAMHKTLFQVGDDTRAYFCLSIANKYLASIIHVGDIALLQNVKLANYGEVIEAVATHISSVQVLLHSSQLVAKTGINELLAHCQVGQTTIEKLRKVVEWAQHTESVLQNVEEVSFQKRVQSTKNWKSQEETDLRNCTSVSEVLHLTETCKASFLACISEIVLQCKGPDNAVESKLLPGKRLLEKVDAGRMEEIICTGCKICGCPVDSRYALEEMKFPLYCQKSTNYVHRVCSIYRPFLLYVWDHSEHVALLVKNKAAEILFGNISAEDVYKCYKSASMDDVCERDPSCSHIPAGEETIGSQQLESRNVAKHTDGRQKLDFYSIWLLLVKLLLHNENSPFEFEVSVHLERDQGNYRFELISLRMPCYSGDEP